jgi:hypothetical protein
MWSWPLWRKFSPATLYSHVLSPSLLTPSSLSYVERTKKETDSTKKEVTKEIDVTGDFYA